jgi:formate dehydrogenase
MVNDSVLKGMKRGSSIVNTARAELCDRDAIVRALKSGQLAGYANRRSLGRSCNPTSP